MCVVLCCVVRVGKGKRRWKRIHELIGFQNNRINMDDLNQWDFQCETELDMIFQFFKCKVLGSELYVQCDSCEWCDQCNSIWFFMVTTPMWVNVILMNSWMQSWQTNYSFIDLLCDDDSNIHVMIDSLNPCFENVFFMLRKMFVQFLYTYAINTLLYSPTIL